MIRTKNKNKFCKTDNFSQNNIFKLQFHKTIDFVSNYHKATQFRDVAHEPDKIVDIKIAHMV
jgi:hypothetical protein